MHWVGHFTFDAYGVTFFGEKADGQKIIETCRRFTYFCPFQNLKTASKTVKKHRFMHCLWGKK